MNDRVVSNHFPFVRISLEFRGAPGAFEIEALIDTGFEGFVIVPTDLIPLEAVPVDQTTYQLGDGRRIRTPLFLASMSFAGLPITMGVLVANMGDEVLIGRGVTDHFRVSFDHGRQVIVEP